VDIEGLAIASSAAERGEQEEAMVIRRHPAIACRADPRGPSHEPSDFCLPSAEFIKASHATLALISESPPEAPAKGAARRERRR
jgi:hypothetical protein